MNLRDCVIWEFLWIEVGWRVGWGKGVVLFFRWRRDLESLCCVDGYWFLVREDIILD